MGAAVTVRGLVKRYGAEVAVDHLDLDVATGSIVGLIGPNGAGKTTTMLVLASLLAPDAGQVEVCGADPVREPRRVRATVGWMPDFFGVYQGLSAAEYLDFFAAAYHVPTRERPGRVADLLELVRLTDRADTDVRGLSRGMQQRLGLARALVHDPRLLILDEPASGLDPRARVELREILLALARQGTTILLSSHILAELAEMCDHLVIVQHGRAVAAGSMEVLAAHAGGGAVGVTVRLLDPALVDRAAAVVTAAGGTVDRLDPPHLWVRLTGGAPAAAELLARLVAEGVPVVSYTDRQLGLEQVFMQLTAEGVA